MFPLPLLNTGPVGRVKEQHKPEGCSGLIRKDRDYTPKLLQALAKKYWKKDMGGWILRVLAQRGLTTKLNNEERVNLGACS